MLSAVFRKNPNQFLRFFCHRALDPTCIQIKQVQPSDYCNAIHTVASVFLDEEPLTRAIGITNTDENMKALTPCLDKPDEGISYKAVDQRDDILGIALNSISSPNDLKIMQEHSRKCKNLQLSFLMYLWSIIQEESDLHARFNCDKIFDISTLVSLPNSRGLGVGQLLMKRSLDRCNEMGLKLARVDCTSAFTAKLSERLGMKEVWCKSFEDLKDPSGKLRVNILSPHTHVRTYVMEF